MPFGTRRQQHRGRGQTADESAIEVSADELPAQVVEDHAQGEEMQYEEQGGDEEEEEEEEEEVEGELSTSTSTRLSRGPTDATPQKSSSNPSHLPV